MTNSPDYRLYLQECFKEVESNFQEVREDFKEVKEDLKEIRDHLKEINGTVAEHTKYIVYADSVIKIRGEQSGEFAVKLKELDKDLEEYRIIKKYPKLAMYALIVAMGLAIVGFISTTTGIKRLKNEVDMINTPVRTRGGAIEFWPSGVLIDSLEKK